MTTNQLTYKHLLLLANTNVNQNAVTQGKSNGSESTETCQLTLKYSKRAVKLPHFLYLCKSSHGWLHDNHMSVHEFTGVYISAH